MNSVGDKEARINYPVNGSGQWTHREEKKKINAASTSDLINKKTN